MKSKRRKETKEKLSFEKTTIVTLNKNDMARIKGGGAPVDAIGSNNPLCGSKEVTTG
ncbi:hypothetical protein HDE69_005169 [Pedobacter cryoconitis]|uniref:Uncharacterized protein n=1 Tax=Pedobacter cryoconitis TaxID=188932 RepID=A0A7W8YYB0_9SPHI|nr:class I lanthipeptide [Pedobacter cryoconitis]MBB5624072.1 hypothetical protein [Pedobacter cryoconitis]